jgi:hypothetical protein
MASKGNTTTNATIKSVGESIFQASKASFFCKGPKCFGGEDEVGVPLGIVDESISDIEMINLIRRGLTTQNGHLIMLL